MKLTYIHAAWLVLFYIVGCMVLWLLSERTCSEGFQNTKHVRHLYTMEIKRGMGDFIRGSLVLAKFCKDRGVPFDVDYSMHPIHQYMLNSKKNQSIESDMNNIVHFKEDYTTDKEVASVLEAELAKKDVVFMCACNPLLQYPLDEDVREFIRDSFLPTPEIQSAVSNTIKQLLGSKKPYAVIHARIGDKVLVYNGAESTEMYDKIRQAILAHAKKIDTPILVLSDDLKFKNYLHEEDGYIVVSTIPKHTIKEGDMKDTILDFFILCGASTIIQYSTYQWGSGFSDRAADLYNIPVHRVNISE